MKTALLVMGVGRSGTSALTRVLSLLGSALPRDVLRPDFGNERGYWEPTQLVMLSEEMLRLHASHWHDSRSFPAEWFTSEPARGFVARATALIQQEYSGAPLIVIKDPRVCRLAPIYLAALERAGYRACPIIPLRHPGEIIASLRERDGTDPAVSELIWLRHLLESEAATRGSPRVWLTYDELLADWRNVARTIADAFAVAWPVAPDTAAPAVVAYLEPELRHFDARQHQGGAGPLSARLWQAAQCGLCRDEPRLRAGFDEVRGLVDEIDRLAAIPFTAEIASLRAELLRLQQRAAESEALAVAMLRSKTWRLTQPLRSLRALARTRLLR